MSVSTSAKGHAPSGRATSGEHKRACGRCHKKRLAGILFLYTTLREVALCSMCVHPTISEMRNVGRTGGVNAGLLALIAACRLRPSVF